MSEKSPIAPQSHTRRPYQEPWISRCKTPLFWEPIQRKPIEEKLANMKAAIAAGADVNELDHAPDPRRSCGRPLDMAVKEDDCNWEDLKHNIPIIKFLLEHGADPRLEGIMGAPSPLDYARYRAREWPPPDLEMLPFYRTVYVMLRDAATRLDDKENGLREEGGSSASQSSKAVFQSCFIA